MNEQEKERKFRLERELRFLKESLDSGIISKEEHEKGKERIERKIKEIEEREEEEQRKSEEEPREVQEEIRLEPDKEEVKEEKREAKPEVKEEIEIEEYAERVPEGGESPFEAETIKEKLGVEKKEKPKIRIIREEKKSKLWLWAILAIAVIVLSFYMCTPKSAGPGGEESIQEEINLPVCSSDGDCYQEGMIGICNNPGMENAECSFVEPVKVNLIVLNDESCKSCDTKTTLKIINSLFPGVNYDKVDYNSEEGKKLINDFGIEVLPAYIFDSSLENAYNYEQVKRAFIKKDGSYLMSAYSSGANYYFRRSEMKNKLELFAIANSTNTIKAEKNLKEVLELFGNKMAFDEHLIEAGKKDKTSEELGINTYPVFLINNKFRLNGVQAAETIKEKFCEWNALAECSEELSRDLK